MKMLVEFYNAESGGLIESIRACACPDAGEKVNIRGEHWFIRSRSWILDYMDLAASYHQIRVCLNCEPTDGALA